MCLWSPREVTAASKTQCARRRCGWRAHSNPYHAKFSSTFKKNSFSMKNTRSYSLNETHILHWCLELSRASCEFHKSPKLFPASWKIHRCQKLFRASWEDSESIQTDLMDLKLAMAMLRNTVEPTGEEKRRVDARLHELHCNSGLCSNRTLADRLRRDGAPQSVCKPVVVLIFCACESRATSTTKPSDV